MEILVMKFGGAAVATPEQFSSIAELIAMRMTELRRIVVVVSAMGNTTDELIALAKRVNPAPPQRELDMLVSIGERVSISLLAMALAHKGIAAVSFTGSQSGIVTCCQHTDARIVDVRPHRLLPHLEAGRIVIVAGFQGVSQLGEITTLGRGGSDTTAVALAVALGEGDLTSRSVEFYKDVGGIFSEDPRRNPKASLLPQLGYQEALQVVSGGAQAQVLHPRCIKLAEVNQVPLRVRSFKRLQEEGSVIQGKGDIEVLEKVYEKTAVV